jgi:hypothetical protein
MVYPRPRDVDSDIPQADNEKKNSSKKIEICSKLRQKLFSRRCCVLGENTLQDKGQQILQHEAESGF